MSWSDHINYVLSKISKNNGILSKIQFFIDKTVALMLYNSLIYPYLSYCNIFWASNYTSRLKSLHISQKRSIRILFDIHPSSSSKPSFYENSILNIYRTNDFLIAIFMYIYIYIYIDMQTIYCRIHLKTFLHVHLIFTHIVCGPPINLDLKLLEPCFH